MKRILPPALLVLAALLLTGCTTNQQSPSAGEPSVSGPESIQTDPSTRNPDAAGGEAITDDSAQQVIVTGFLTLTVENPADAVKEAVQIVERANGRVDNRSEFAPTDGNQGSAQLTVRIPTESLTETLAQLRGLGEVEEVNIGETNVTAESTDLEGRITALRASVDRLLALMASAATTADLIAIESALSERQANLEGLESQKRFLDDQVELSTINVYLGSQEDAPVDEPDTFLSGLQAGWDALVSFLGLILVVAGVLLPWVVVLGIIALVAMVLIRRRSRARALRARGGADTGLAAAAHDQHPPQHAQEGSNNDHGE